MHFSIASITSFVITTDEAKYCLSATAERNGLKLVAVVLAAPDTKTRFREAASLLNRVKFPL